MLQPRFHPLASFCLLSAATGLAISGGCSGPPAPSADEHLGVADQHLDEDQCVYFDVNGRDTICHHTSSLSHPFTLIKISEQACINAHDGHAQDYITSLDPSSSLYDPTCNGQGCLPANAPCDDTLDCCIGSCVNGTCPNPNACEAVDCTAIGENMGLDPECFSATCDPSNGTCSFVEFDGQPCSGLGVCEAGGCVF